MKVANPSSQDRTPRWAILLAVSPATVPYRASGLVQQPLTDVGYGSMAVAGRLMGTPSFGTARRVPALTFRAKLGSRISLGWVSLWINNYESRGSLIRNDAPP